MQKQNKLVILLLLCLFAARALAQQVTKAEQIKHFYECYVRCSDESFKARDYSIVLNCLGKFMTPEMLKKRVRLIHATDSDPLLRAQDEPNSIRQTLTCRHLEGDWFEVAYRSFNWTLQDTVTTRIPVRTEEDENGMVRINYITPDWGGERYGDYLFDIPAQKVTDQLDARTFVETFFKTYTYPYATMSPSLEQDLEQLRKRHCTPFLQEKYASLKQQFREWDGINIDPLVNDADFDAFWYPTIRIEPIDSLTFRFGYDIGINGWHRDIKVMVTRINGRFLLSDIELE